MDSTKWIWWGGVAAVIGGLTWMGFHLWYVMTELDLASLIVAPANLRILIVSVLLFIGTLWALRWASDASGGMKTSLMVAIMGLALMAIGLFGIAFVGVGAMWLAGIVGELVTSIGLLIFGIANLRDGILPRFNFLPLLMVLVYLPSWMVDPGNLSPPLPPHWTEWLAAVYGLGWVALGVVLLWQRVIRSPTAVQP